MRKLLFATVILDESRSEKAVHIYENYYSYMIYIAGRYLKTPSDREDAAHDSMLRLISIIDSIDFSNEAKLKGLCGVVTKNVALNICKRKDKSSISLEEIFDVADDSVSPEDNAVSNDTVTRLVISIEALNEVYRDVLKLKYLNQLKEIEIAKLLELPVKTVNQRIFRGKRLLRKAMEEDNLNG